MAKCRVRYDHIFDGKTRKYFDDKVSAHKHIKVMLNRYPYAIMYIEVPTKTGGWKPDSTYKINKKGLIRKQ